MAHTKVINGKRVELTSAELSEFSNSQLSNEEILESKKSDKLMELKNIKNKYLYQDIDYLEVKFNSSEKAIQNILGALILSGEENQWLDIFGNPITLTKSQLQELGILIKQQRDFVYQKEAALEKQINDCSTIEEVNSLVLDFK